MKIQAWAEDALEAETAALVASFLPTSRERLRALTVAFQQSAKVSLRYADPVRARQELVKIISAAFVSERAARRKVGERG